VSGGGYFFDLKVILKQSCVLQGIQYRLNDVIDVALAPIWWMVVYAHRQQSFEPVTLTVAFNVTPKGISPFGQKTP
jgi:hypothetical protein